MTVQFDMLITGKLLCFNNTLQANSVFNITILYTYNMNMTVCHMP